MKFILLSSLFHDPVQQIFKTIPTYHLLEDEMRLSGDDTHFYFHKSLNLINFSNKIIFCCQQVRLTNPVMLNKINFRAFKQYEGGLKCMWNAERCSSRSFSTTPQIHSFISTTVNCQVQIYNYTMTAGLTDSVP